jgi:hypothetical protein
MLGSWVMVTQERSRELARERLQRFRARQKGQEIPKRKPGPAPVSHLRRLERQLSEVRAEIGAWLKRDQADDEELARLQGRQASLVCALENLEGRPYRILGPEYPFRPDLGPAILWKPGTSQILYLGDETPPRARWQFNVRAPEWGAWEVGKPYPAGTVYVQAEPGRRAVPGEWVPAIYTAVTMNEYGGQEFAARALFAKQELLAGKVELRPELAEIFRTAAEESAITGGKEASRSLLLKAAEVVVETGRVHMTEEGAREV